VEKLTGRRPPELDIPDLPPAVDTLYHAWRQIAATRQYGEAGPAPITWAEIAGWQQAMHTALNPWEAETLQEMDRAALGEIAAFTPRPAASQKAQ